MSAAIATKRQEIKDCEEQCQDSSTSGAETKGNNLQYDYLQTLRALWDDKALCLELLTMMPALYGCRRFWPPSPNTIAIGWHFCLSCLLRFISSFRI